MRVERLWLTDFRNYESADVSPAPGLTAVVGDNGEGKTNLLEAVGYLATLGSFRGAPGEVLVRAGCEQAVVRAEIDNDGRVATIEAELHAAGRDRVLVNRQPLRRARALLVGRLGPAVADAYDAVAPTPARVSVRYEAAWRVDGLAAALAAARDDDVRRGASTVGPHRDEVALAIAGLPARTHASQGE